MKNKSESRTKRLFTRVFNYRVWSDWSRNKSFLLYIKVSLMRLFVFQPKGAGESFDDAVVRLNLTDSDLLARQKGLLHLSLTMLGMALLLFAYIIYLLICGGILGAILSFVILLIALVLAFRYHFWYFQIKTRKLGCTMKEWFQHGLMRGK